MRMQRALRLGFVVGLSSACAGTTDRAVLDSPWTARRVGENAGVRLEIRPAIEHPGELNHEVMPLYAAVSNGSGRDLIVQPEAFALVAPDGERQTAIRPSVLRRSAETSVGTDIAITLRALPTDVLRRGGRTQGFLYFPPVSPALPTALQFELRAQHDAEPFGLIAIPLNHQAAK